LSKEEYSDDSTLGSEAMQNQQLQNNSDIKKMKQMRSITSC